MAEPAEEDVRRLVALIDEGNYHDSTTHPGRLARNLLAAGVTLPPEPDTPAEAEERYWVGDGESDNKVYERGRAHIYAETYLTLDASRIARLLNLDESVKNDVCSGLHEAYPALVEQLTFARKRGDEFQAKFEEQCQRGDGLFTGRYETMKRAIAAEAERDEARAEVERLTALVREVAAAGVATTNRKYVEVQVDVDTWADLRAEIGEPPADGHYPAGVRPAAPTVTAEMLIDAGRAFHDQTGSVHPYDDRDRQIYADALNRLLAERGGEG